MLESVIWLAVAAAAFVLLLTVGSYTLFKRRVVPTNEVHIVQTGRTTVSYGANLKDGNVYYEWPSWFPRVGLTVRTLPVSNFAIDLDDYEAYDKDRVPFLVTIKAFFRVSDSNVAAQRVASTGELYEQLEAIVQGAVRTTLAKHDIDSIMGERAVFGEYFTNEVSEQLKNWGVETVKNIELMDIRDARDSKVIANIMAKRTSEIEKDSRVTVAENQRAAQTAEIDARRDVDLRKQAATQQVGQREAEVQREVGIAEEQAKQAVASEKALTTERTMQVRRIEQTKQAEIDREVAVVEADQAKQTDVIRAEGEARQTVVVAEGKLEAKRRESEGIKLEGDARAAAETAILLAPVTAQITLAEKIGSDTGYQNYLITVRQIEAAEKIGLENASALEQADVKVIVNSDSPTAGLKSVGDLFSSKGGLNFGAMLEGLKQSGDAGASLVDKVTG